MENIPHILTTNEEFSSSTDGLPLELSELVEKCINNERAAQEKFYRMFHGRMMGLCMRFFSNRDDAKEALNVGFLKVFRSLSSYQGKGSLEGWIYRIIHNTALDFVRKKVVFENRIEEISESSAQVQPEVIQKYYVNELLNLLHSLPEATKVVFTLFVIENYSHKEIAKQLEISEGTSKWHVNNARQLLKKQLSNPKRTEL